MCVCVFVCGRVGMQDRRSAGRDKCSNLSSPSHSHPSAQTSKSLPLGLPRTHTSTHPHMCEQTHTHRSLISTLSPTPISVFTVIPNPKQRHTWRQKREGWTASAIAQLSVGFINKVQGASLHIQSPRSIGNICSLELTSRFRKRASRRGVVQFLNRML